MNRLIDIGLYDSVIRKRGYIFYDRKKLSKVMGLIKNDAVVYESMATDFVKQRSSGSINFLSKDTVLTYLMDYENCPSRYFKTRGVKGYSINMKRCLLPLKSNCSAPVREFLDYYMTYRSLNSLVNSTKEILDNCNRDDAVDHNGNVLSKLPFDVNQQANLRFNYRNYDVIAQIPKKAANCISVDDGYVLVWGDAAQSDIRIAYNLFLRSPENDVVFSKYDDKYEALARIVSRELGEEFDPVKFKDERPVYKRLALATMYGTRGSQVSEDDRFISIFSQFLSKCPKYQAYYDTLSDMHYLGLPLTIYSYFGNELTSPVFPTQTQTVDRALNCPNQTGTSEVIMLVVLSVLERFKAMGYSDDDVSLYLVRHDEPIFRVKKEVMADSWVFRCFEQIHIDDWIPLSFNFSFGYNYGIEDENLMKEYKESGNRVKTPPFIVKCRGEGEEYFPVRTVLSLSVYHIFVDDVAIVTVYDHTRNLATHLIVMSNDAEVVWDTIRSKLHKLHVEGNYSGIIVSNSFYNGEDYTSGNLYVRYRKAEYADLDKVANLCRYGVCFYCKGKKIESPVKPPLERYSDFIKSVKELRELS